MIRPGDTVKIIKNTYSKNDKSFKEFEKYIGQTGKVLSRSEDGNTILVRLSENLDKGFSRNQITKIEEA